MTTLLKHRAGTSISPRNRKTILITGVSGQLGSNIAYAFRNQHDIVGVFNAHRVSINGIETQRMNILDVDNVSRIIQHYRPAILIHCAALVNVDRCEADKELAKQVNVAGTKAVVDSTKGLPIKFVYISTDSVYDGTKGHFSETDTPNPQNYYGLTKYQGELEALRALNPLIFRTNIFGWNVQNKFSLAEWIIHELSSRTAINGFRDVSFSTIYTFELARVLSKALEQDLVGIYNCGSSRPISKYDFAILIAERFALDTTLIKRGSISQVTFKARRGRNLSLDVSKLSRDLGITLPSIPTSIDSFYDDSKNGLLDHMLGT